MEQNISTMQPATEPIGMIEEVHGPVIDVVCDRLPPLHQALICVFDHEHYTFEVYRHLITKRVSITLVFSGQRGAGRSCIMRKNARLATWRLTRTGMSTDAMEAEQHIAGAPMICREMMF